MARRIKLSGCIARHFDPLHAALRREAYGEYWLSGGRGSGKSSFISLEIWLGLLRHPEANALVCRKVAGTLRESVYEQMLWAAEALGLGERVRARLSPLELVYAPTGQRVLFRGADDPGKSKSIKLARGYFKYLWFEELTEFSGMEDVRTIKASVIRGGGPASTFYSYNPPRSLNNWTNAEALSARPDRLRHHSDYRQMPPEWLGESFIREAELLRAANERAWRHIYLGEAVGTGGQVFDNLELRAITEEELAGFDRFRNGLDFGFAVDPDAFVRLHVDVKRRAVYFVDEYVQPHTPIDRLAEEVRTRAGGELVTCDSADPRMIAELRQRGLRATGAKKGPGSVERGLRWLQELSRIVIDPGRCPAAAREFSRYEYARDREGNCLAEYPDKDNHTIDAARYALEGVLDGKTARTLERGRLGI